MVVLSLLPLVLRLVCTTRWACVDVLRDPEMEASPPTFRRRSRTGTYSPDAAIQPARKQLPVFFAPGSPRQAISQPMEAGCVQDPRRMISVA